MIEKISLSLLAKSRRRGSCHSVRLPPDLVRSAKPPRGAKRTTRPHHGNGIGRNRGDRARPWSETLQASVQEERSRRRSPAEAETAASDEPVAAPSAAAARPKASARLYERERDRGRRHRHRPPTTAIQRSVAGRLRPYLAPRNRRLRRRGRDLSGASTNLEVLKTRGGGRYAALSASNPRPPDGQRSRARSSATPSVCGPAFRRRRRKTRPLVGLEGTYGLWNYAFTVVEKRR